MQFDIKENKRFRYVEEGDGEVLLLLHGLFGGLHNYEYILEEFKSDYKVVIPLLPIFEMPVFRATLDGLTDHVRKFVAEQKYTDISVLGNSLGGHIALKYALKEPDNVRSIILTGSSGLYEKSLGDTFPKRGDYQFIKERTEYTFYRPETATKELVDNIYEIVNNRNKAIRVISTAKSAIRNNLAKRLPELDIPTLLIWGKNDNITPPYVGEEFKKLLPNAELKLIEECGHAPMMEQHEKFNALLNDFLNKIYATT